MLIVLKLCSAVIQRSEAEGDEGVPNEHEDGRLRYGLRSLQPVRRCSANEGYGDGDEYERPSYSSGLLKLFFGTIHDGIPLPCS